MLWLNDRVGAIVSITVEVGGEGPTPRRPIDRRRETQAGTGVDERDEPDVAELKKDGGKRLAATTSAIRTVLDLACFVAGSHVYRANGLHLVIDVAAGVTLRISGHKAEHGSIATFVRLERRATEPGGTRPSRTAPGCPDSRTRQREPQGWAVGRAAWVRCVRCLAGVRGVHGARPAGRRLCAGGSARLRARPHRDRAHPARSSAPGGGARGPGLEYFGLTVERVREQVVRIVGPGEAALPPSGQIPFTPRAKRVLEMAPREALSLGQTVINTEHILLGLVRENDGVASRILLDLERRAGKDSQRGDTDERGSSRSARLRSRLYDARTSLKR